MIWQIELSRRYGEGAKAFALEVSFASDASRLVLYGPSGAGKSQTLKMLAGLVPPETGRIAFQGDALFDSDAGIDVRPQARRLAYVFQNYALFPHLTVRQNIAFGLGRGLRNPSRRFADPRVERWIEGFDLGVVEHLYPPQISGGQQQRTALARALVTEPRALLLDEPFAALDRKLRQHLRGELLALQAELRLPIILITHDEEDVTLFAEEVIEIEAGRRRQEAP